MRPFGQSVTVQDIKSLLRKQYMSADLVTEPPLTFGVDVLPSGDDLQARSEPRTETDAKSLIDAIFGDGFMWAAVPKKRSVNSMDLGMRTINWHEVQLYKKLRKLRNPNTAFIYFRNIADID